MGDLDDILRIPDAYKETFKGIIKLNTPGPSLETLAGLNIAALTPINPDGKIDEKAFLDYYERLILEAGVRGLLISGATGEGEFVTNEQYLALLKCANQLKEKYGIKIIAGILAQDGEGMKQGARYLETVRQTYDFDYILFTPPLGTEISADNFTQGDFVALFSEIAKITSKDLLIYRTKLANVNPSLDTLLEISRVTNGRLKAVKDTMPIEESLIGPYSKSDDAQEAFELIQGNDNLFYDVFYNLFEMGLENVGNTSGGCNILPLAQIRQILAASIKKAHEYGFATHKGKDFLQLAWDAQFYLSTFYGNNLRGRMKDVGPTDLRGRREAVLLKGFAWVASGYQFPLQHLDTERMHPFDPALTTDYVAALDHSALKRNQFLERYAALN